MFGQGHIIASLTASPNDLALWRVFAAIYYPSSQFHLVSIWGSLTHLIIVSHRLESLHSSCPWMRHTLKSWLWHSCWNSLANINVVINHIISDVFTLDYKPRLSTSNLPTVRRPLVRTLYFYILKGFFLGGSDFSYSLSCSSIYTV